MGPTIENSTGTSVAARCRTAFGVAACTVAVLSAVAAAPSAAAPLGSITTSTYGLTGANALGGIVAGHDGNLWFTDPNGTDPAIGRLTLEGTLTRFTGLNADSAPQT